MLDKIIKFFAGFFAVVLLLVGLRWLLDPSAAAAMLEMELLDGKGRSSQVGDMTAYFLFAGGSALLGLIRRSPVLLYTPAVLVGLTAVFRLLAWQVHGAGLMGETIVQEVLMCVAFVVAGKRMSATA